MGRPARGARGLPGNLTEAKRAGITATTVMPSERDSILGFALRQETASSASPERWRSAWRALLAIAAVMAAAAAATGWHRRVEDRRRLHTGRAEWIWYERAGRLPHPLHFYAFREWELATPPPRATALVFADPEGVLWVNGARIAV